MLCQKKDGPVCNKNVLEYFMKKRLTLHLDRISAELALLIQRFADFHTLLYPRVIRLHLQKNKSLSEGLYFVFFQDETGVPRIQKRMKICEALYKERELGTYTVEMKGKSFLHKIFQNIFVANWTVFYLAQHYGSLTEGKIGGEFEKRIKEKPGFPHS